MSTQTSPGLHKSPEFQAELGILAYGCRCHLPLKICLEGGELGVISERFGEPLLPDLALEYDLAYPELEF